MPHPVPLLYLLHSSGEENRGDSLVDQGMVCRRAAQTSLAVQTETVDSEESGGKATGEEEVKTDGQRSSFENEVDTDQNLKSHGTMIRREKVKRRRVSRVWWACRQCVNSTHTHTHTHPQ